MEVIRPFGQIPQIKTGAYNENYVTCAWIKNFLTIDEVATVKNAWNDDDAMIGKVQDTNKKQAVLDYNIRKARQMYLDADEHSWLYDKLAMASIMINANRFKFDINGFQDRLRIVRYETGDFFDWHTDYGPANVSNRKLAVSIQLSDSEDYEGGDLQFLNHPPEEQVPRSIGSAIFFPAFVTHKVTPVVSGIRYAIVGLIAGPPFR